MKKTFYTLFALIILFAIGLVAFPPILLKYQPIEAKLQQQLDAVQGGSLTYESVSYSYVPFFEIHLKGVSIQNSFFKEMQLSTNDVSIRVSRLYMLFGRLKVAQLRFEDASLTLEVPSKTGLAEQITFDHVDWRIGPIGKNSVSKVSLTADHQQTEQALNGYGSLSFAGGGDLSWDQMGIDLQFEFKPLPMQILQGVIRDFLKVRYVSGVWWGYWRIQKDAGESKLNAAANLAFNKFAYKLFDEANGYTSPEFDAAAVIDMDWDASAESLTFNKAQLTMPVGTFDLRGSFLLPTKELQDVRFSASNIVLESIPQYFVHLKDLIPFNIGFSGQSQLEMSLTGTWDHLSIHGNWDLNSALLTYARYFSKAKDVPTNVMMEFLLKDNHILSGDFSVHLKDATFKGTLTDVDTSSGYGQVNVITNKFSLKSWETIVPPFNDYEFDGQAKFLANLKGNLQKLYETQAMFNISIQDGYVKSPDGHELKDLKLALDISPLSLDIRNSKFTVGDSRVKADLVIYNLNESPLIEMEVASDELDLSQTYLTMQDFFSNWISEDKNRAIARVGEKIGELFPVGQVMKNALLKLTYENGIWTMPESKFEAYLGDVLLNGSMSFGEDGVAYQWDSSIQRMSLSRFFNRKGEEVELIDGNLFLKINLKGEENDLDKWLETLTGSGTFLMTNGKIHSFNALQTFKNMSQLATVIAAADQGGTDFDDVRANFVLGSQKISTEDLTLVSKNIGFYGRGEATLDGSLNFSLDGFLTEAALESSFGQKMVQEGRSEIGPLPMLLTGPMTRPNLSSAPSLTSGKIQRLLDFSNQKMGLRNFYSEDRLFGRS